MRVSRGYVDNEKVSKDLMKTATLNRLSLTVVVFAAVLYLSSVKYVFIGTMDSPFFSIALLSLFLILLRTGTNLRELGATAILFALLCWLELAIFGYRSSWPVWISLLGMASLGVLCGRAIWADGPRRRLAVLILVPSFLFVLSEWLATYFLFLTQLLHPKVLDLYLYSFDASLRVQLPFVMGRVFARWAAFSWTCDAVYIGLPVAIGLTFAGCALKHPRVAWRAFMAFLLTGPLGIVFYNVFPALGPVHIFESRFPWNPLTSEQARHLFLEAVAVPGARNAIPSLHAAWVFLVFWYARGLSRLERTLAAICMVLTLCATVGTGEHYFIDLIVAVPFAVLVLSLTNVLLGPARLRQILPLSIGAGGVLVWLEALHHATFFFWRSWTIPWLACILTLAVCYLAVRRLTATEGTEFAGDLSASAAESRSVDSSTLHNPSICADENALAR